MRALQGERLTAPPDVLPAPEVAKQFGRAGLTDEDQVIQPDFLEPTLEPAPLLHVEPAGLRRAGGEAGILDVAFIGLVPCVAW